MIFENTYAWPGTTAIIYNLEFDHDFLGFYLEKITNSVKSKILLPIDSELIGMGIEYKKESDLNWIDFLILNENSFNTIKNTKLSAENATNLAKSNFDSFKYVVSAPTGYEETNYISPLRIVIKNLDQETTYNIRSYYIKNNGKQYFNECLVTTFKRKDIYYECIEVTGNTEDRNNMLKNRINEACEIYNAMTCFSRATAPSDNLNSKNGGQFTAVYDSNLPAGVAAHSGMHFGSYNPNVYVVIHEMAHNIMKDQIDERENEEAYNKIVKFMEFATHTEGATWRWQNGHNYPVISSSNTPDAYNYMVTAACQVCRDASNKI